MTNSERVISRQRSVLPAPGQARHDWDIIAEVGRRMGWVDAFDYQSPAEIFTEHAGLSAVAGGFGKDFDISGLIQQSQSDFDAMEPVRWPVAGGTTGGRFFGDGKFFTEDGRARMIALTPQGPAARPSPALPFVLNTGRIRDQWHTMTRSGKSPRLGRHLAEPFAELHPEDAKTLSVTPSDILSITNSFGRALLRVLITERVHPGQVFVPIHWTGTNAAAARVDTLVAPNVDPFSGQPESKATPVHIERFAADWYGYAVSTARPTPKCAYWALTAAEAGWRMDMAGTGTVADWEAQARSILGCEDAEVIIMNDPARGTRRFAFARDGVLVGALFVGPTPVAVSRQHVADCLGRDPVSVLAGRPGAEVEDPGQTLCSCLGVGVNTISRAIRRHGLTHVAAVGEATGAGTNCGSCRSEIATLIARLKIPEAAE